jgi:hypothetical protein
MGIASFAAQPRHSPNYKGTIKRNTCGADWQFPRLQCMFCGNENHKTLSDLYPESQRDQMRVETCDNCHGYLKVIAAFSPTPVELLAVETWQHCTSITSRKRAATRVWQCGEGED